MIQSQAEAQWQALPSHFRLESSLKQCVQGPFERDFVAGVRLHHLHVLFLLRLLLLRSPTEPDLPIIETAGQMLTLVVEIILLRDQLTNSGTGLIWKVSRKRCSLPVSANQTGRILRSPRRGNDTSRDAQTSYAPSPPDTLIAGS